MTKAKALDSMPGVGVQSFSFGSGFGVQSFKFIPSFGVQSFSFGPVNLWKK